MNEALLIFARYPRLGRVKTRLAPALPPAESLRLYTAFLLDTVERTAGLDVARRLFLADCSESEAKSLLEPLRPAACPQVDFQRGADLGDRMWNAYRSVGLSNRVVFIGSDSPTLPLSYVCEAFRQLRELPVAIGPGEDGGYYLLGLSEPRRELFYGVDWGTERVLGQTLERLSEGDYALLPPWRDVDTPEDLLALKRDLDSDFEGFPTRTALAVSQLPEDDSDRGLESDV